MAQALLFFALGVCAAVGLPRIWRNDNLSLRTRYFVTIGVGILVLLMSAFANRSERIAAEGPVPDRDMVEQRGGVARKEETSSEANRPTKHQDSRKLTGPQTRSPDLPSTAKVQPSPDLPNFLATPAVVEAQDELSRIARLQSQSDYAAVQDVIRQVVSAKGKPPGGWEMIDVQAANLSPDTREAYERWRMAVNSVTPAKYSLEDVRAATSRTHAFASEEAIATKRALLNTADRLGVTDQALTTDVLKNIENGKYEWASADLLMEHAHYETQQAYRLWKAAVVAGQ